MNKSKFLKRSLAALLAILMVATMIPSAFAAGEDAPEIFVDNRRTTYDGDNKYSITIYDTDDVLISWTPIPGTKMRVVTKDGIDKDLDARIYLPENANLVSSDEYKTYSLKLQKIESKKDPVDYTLSITIKSTKPANECRLGGVRVDKTSGTYKLGYLGGGTAVLGYSNKVEAAGIEAHAIEGVVSGSTVTVTLPFGMTPEDVGFDGVGIANDITATAVFAPMSVVAKSHYTYNPTTKTGSVRVTAKSGATKTYTVKFESEQVFESFEGATNLADLKNVTKIDTNKATAADGSVYSRYTLKVNKKVADPTSTTAAYTWVPEFVPTERAQRIMGVGEASRDTRATTLKLEKQAKADGTANSGTEIVNFTAGAVTPPANSNMLRLVTSGHAEWDIGANQMVTDNPDYVYLLVRTKANPSGAYVEVQLNPVLNPAAGPRITEIQAANTLSSESAAFVAADATSIDVVLDKEYGDEAGGSETQGDKTDISKVYLHVTTDTDAYVRIPSQEANNPAVTSSSWDSSTPSTRHLLKNVNAKDGSVTIQITDKNGKNPRNYRVNFRVATTNHTELERVALYTADGVKVAESIKQADKTAPRELEVPYEYFPTPGDVSQDPTGAVAGSPLANLYLCVFPSDGAAVAPGKFPTTIDVSNVAIDSSTTDTNGDNKPDLFENGATKVSNVWTIDFVEDNAGTPGADFDDTLFVTVSNAGAGTEEKTYQIVLKRKLPKTEAELDSVETNKALDANYVYSQANTLGREKPSQSYEQTVGTPAPNPADIGQAYIAAKDIAGNDLPARISGNDIIVTVPANWDASTDTLYLTKLVPSADTEKVYRSVFDTMRESSASGTSIIEASKSVLVPTEQKDQTQNDTAVRDYGGKVNRFKNLTVVGGGAEEQNILYAVSERDYWNNPGLNGADPADVNALKTYSTPYEVHIEYAPDNSEERELKDVQSANPALATASFDAEYGLITISVPDSTDWSDGYRGDRSKNFKLNFEASADALIIDKYQKELNDVTAGSGAVNGAGDASGRYNGATAAQLNEYWQQLNIRDQITNDTEFFVLNGELYIYDPLTGYEIPVTGVGGKFTNNNWATIKSKQAEIQVYDAQQNDKITYRLDLKVGSSQPVSGDNTLASVTANGHAATKSGNDYTVYVPEGTDMSKAKLSLRTTDSGASITSVDGKTYTDGMEVDLSEGKTVTVVVTAANGETVTYTIESTFGSTPVDRPSDKYTDIPAAPMGDYVRSAIDNGIMIGTSATKFSPNMEVSRWQFALLIARADLRVKNAAITNADEADAELIKLYSGTPTFDDTKDLDKLYNAAIEYCNKNGIIDGKGDNKFAPKAVVTRLEAARMISDWTGITDDTKTENTNNIKDWNLVNWGKQYVNAVYDAGFIQGYPNGNFGPKDNLKRGQSAVIIMKAFEYMTDK